MTTRRPTLAARLRTTALAAVLAATGFAVTATPATAPATTGSSPFEGIVQVADKLFAPKTALAAFCASNAVFTGRLTASSGSTTAVSRITDPDVYAYISNVDADWSCTAYLRYSGVAWNTTASAGRFDWGNLINSTSVGCNYLVGSTDFIKANSTADCPDTDAEYALMATLTGERVYHADLNHNTIGDFSFIHADCGTYYSGTVAGEPIQGSESAPETFAGSNVDNRPGANCDALTIDGTGTTQTITYDKTAPTGASVSVNNGATYTTTTAVTLATAATDAVSGVAQMQFSNDNATWSTLQAYATSASWTLAAGDGTKTVYARYRDANGNQSASVSDTIVLDASPAIPNPPDVTCAGTSVWQPALNGVCYFRPSAAATLTVTGAATDAVSGVAHVRFEVLSPTTNWTPTPALPNLDTASPYTEALGFVAATATSTIDVIARNGAGTDGAARHVSLTADSINPTATIALPAANTPIAGPITITGTATDSQTFKEYQLEAGAGSSPASWTSLGTVTAPVSGSTLGTWTPGTLSGAYTIRLTVRDQVGNMATDQRLVYLENTRRGEETFLSRVPFDLGGGWSLDVGVANGEARLSRGLFSVPSYGPAAGLDLAYSSTDLATAGAFGYGWRSNLTQSLTFESGFVVWHRADGGQVPFGLVGSTWTPLAGHFEALTAGTGSDAGRYIVTLKDQTRLVFEGSGTGRLTRIENRFGKRLALGWGIGTATLTDASSRVTTVTFTGSLITSVLDSAGRTWSFHYTATSDLDVITEPDPDGTGFLAAPVTTLGYDASHRLTSITRHRRTAAGGDDTIVWKVGYDAAGKAASVIDPIAHALHGDVANTFTYNPGNTVAALLKTYSPVVRNSTTYTLDPLGRATTITDPEGHASDRFFDDASNLTYIDGVPNPSGPTRYFYDARGNVTASWMRVGLMGDERETAMSYNAANDLLTRSEGDNDSSVRTVTRYGYDAAGHLLTVNVNCTSSGTTPPADASTCTGNGTADASTNLVTAYTYSANDQVETETDPLGQVTKHLYDPVRGNETHLIRNYVAGQSETAERNVTTDFTYDEGSTPDIGLVTTETDPLDHATTRAYDALGRLVTEALPGDGSIPALTRTTTYDEFGNLLTEAETWVPLGGSESDRVTRTTTHEYDRANRETSASDPSGVATSRTFDAAGNTLTETADGTTTTRTFDGRGNAVSETAKGVTTTYTYNGLGEVATSTVDGATRTMEYDIAGQLLYEYIDDGGGGLTLDASHGYDSLGREVETADANGVSHRVVFDRAGRQVASIENDVPGAPNPGQDVTTTYSYDRAGNQTGVTGPDGRLTTTVYDALDRATRVIANDVASPTGPDQDVTTVTAYDGAGNAIASVDPKGVVTRTFANVRNQPMRSLQNCLNTPPVTDPVLCTGSATPTTTVNVETTTTYDGRGDIAASVLHRLGTDPNITTEETRDAAGRLVRSVVDAGSGKLNLTTEYAYDSAGRQSAVRDPRGTITRTTYDNEGRVSATIANCTSADGSIPTVDWSSCPGTGIQDGTRNVTTTYGYDASGNRTSEIAPNGRRTTSLFDDANRLIQRIDNDVTGTPTRSDQDLSTYFSYDAVGRQVAVKAPTLDRTTFTVTRTIYNDLGQVVEEIRNCVGGGDGTPGDCTGTGTHDAQTNIVTSYAYDTAGQVVAKTTPDPSATSGTATVTTRYAYDAVGRLCRVLENASVDLAGLADPCTTAVTGTSTSNLSTRYTYDSAGSLVAMIDAASNTSTYAYDAAGHMSGRTDALGATLAWTYDAMGNRVTQRNRTDPIPTYSVTWSYDAAGRMLTRAADSVTTTYAYDENGNQLTASASGMTITSTYDRLNRVLTVDDEDAGSGADTSYTYSLTSPTWTDPTGTYTATLDAFDRATVLNDPVNAANFTWTYRADGQPLSMTAPNTNVTTYTYDPTGREFDRETKTGLVSRAHYTWTYNRAGQILSEASVVAGDPANGTVTYGYDPLGQLTGSTLAGTTTEYGWDAVTNRTSVKVGAGTPATTAYDAANRPTTGANPTAAYASDADGRLTARPGQTMIWDHLGRLTAVKDASGTTTIASYSHDPLDRLRIADDGAAGRTRFRYVGTTTSVAQWIDDATGIVIRNVGNGWTGERLLDWTGAGSDHRYYGTNAHHDVTWLADATGAVTSRLRYDPWGTPRSAVPAGYTPFRFQGSWHDDTTDLSWVVTRWYAPSLGRFLSEDSLLGEPRHPESRHLYAYAAGEPVARWDPDGRSPAGETRTRLADGVKYYSSGRKREAWRISAERETFYSVALGAPYAVTELGWRGDWAEYVSSTRPSYRYLFYSMPWWKARSDRGIQIKFVASFSIYTARGTHSTVPYVVARVDAESLGSVSAGGLCDCTYSLQTPWNEGPIRKIVIKATTQASQPHSDLQLGVSYVNKLVVKFDYPHNGT